MPRINGSKGDPAVRRASMLTPCHLLPHLGQLVGAGFVLISLFGWFPLPAESASGVEPTAYGEYRDYRDYQGYQDYQDYRSYRRPRYEQPDRFTIRKGKKCEVRCERIWGSRDYRCREYRC
jgi:hypothetical protein